MLRLLLTIAKLFCSEPCSVQREILNRIQNRRRAWDASNDEILEIYEHLNGVIKKRSQTGIISLGQFITFLKHPTSTLNFLNGRKVPINDLEKFRSKFASSNS